MNWRVVASTAEEREEVRKIQRSKISEEKACIYCKEKFNYGYSSLKVCGCCNIFTHCSICNKEFKLDLSVFSGSDQAKINENISENKDLCLFCSTECRRVSQSMNLKLFNDKNIDVYKDAYKKSLNDKYCEICCSITKHRGLDCTVCHGKNAVRKMIQYGKDNPEKEKEHRIKCAESVNVFWSNNLEFRKRNSTNNIQKWNQSEAGKIFSREHCEKLGKVWGPITLERLNSRQKLFCSKCNEEVFHNGFNVCLTCNPRSDTSKNIHDEYCNVCGEITKYNGAYCTTCNPTSKPGGSWQSFITENNILHYFDHSVKDYVPWVDFKDKFKSELNIDFIDQTILSYSDCSLIPTFRVQESDNWNGSRSAFEQSLIEKEIGWFAYVKFYIDPKNIIKPLVAGKTGSLLYNNKGSDISFSEHEDHGPARRFLIDENLNWFKTHILIIPCESEIVAFNVEKEIQLKYNLFGS